ncbi:uncharacterized protein LOC114339689 [Diabrotica virgifera virgifera]|uniref:Uncharacterized protein n=1 Tax=Diabrotica virgifera virgifera TaxID=50390 RepID=A0ABM5IWZ3_DIAVI|nr:uncharacterized protein LOC114339689 [Diabrotica virgifera virgifera]XP_028146157.2 uncharacterized protein LOC114339689 [Diabrotica virgifera virgifera]XP_028146159.2 uncharacterized protein LOC114339689 [Diabrotica virgifera virgifera]XP_028146160.2 uncharacterized protein LOC114339689 [Diabrotica virgifera virgifera]XP_028146161.2 uncharacterized protein LOC114339689 [Diabrotica virgifera virgifera]XP_028146163.2 uncharacterized protein LOC114339689 [Diabrotica virgifera virgifera]
MVGKSSIIYLAYIFLTLQSPLVNSRINYKVMVEEDIIRIHSKSCTDETAVLPTMCKKDLTYIGDASCTFKELNGTGRFILKDAVVNLTTKSNFTYFYWYIHKKWHFLKISLFNGSCNVWVIEQQLKTSEAKVCLDKLSQNVLNEQFPQKNISNEKERHRDRYRIMVDNENILTHLISCNDKTTVIPSMCKKDLTYIADHSCPFKELNDISKFTLKDGIVNLRTKSNFTYLYWYMYKKWYFFKTNLFNSSCNVWVIEQQLKSSEVELCLDKLSENQNDEHLPRKNISNKQEIHRDRYKIMVDKENILIHSLSCKHRSTIPSVCQKDLKYVGDASCPFKELNDIQAFTLKDDIVHSTTKLNFTYLYWYINKSWYFLKTSLFNSSCNIWVIEQQLKSSEVELCLDQLSENLRDEQFSQKKISNEKDIHRDQYKIMIDKKNILIHSVSCKDKTAVIPSVCKKDLTYIADASCPFKELNDISKFTLKNGFVNSTTKSNFTYFYWYIYKKWYFLTTSLFNSNCNVWVIEQQLKSSEVELCLDKLSENLEQISRDQQVSPKNISNEEEVHRDDANTQESSVSKLIYTNTTAKKNLVSSTSAPSIKETTDKNWLKGVLILTVVTLLFLVLLLICTSNSCLGYDFWKRIVLICWYGSQNYLRRVYTHLWEQQMCLPKRPYVAKGSFPFKMEEHPLSPSQCVLNRDQGNILLPHSSVSVRNLSNTPLPDSTLKNVRCSPVRDPSNTPLQSDSPIISEKCAQCSSTRCLEHARLLPPKISPRNNHTCSQA